LSLETKTTGNINHNIEKKKQEINTVFLRKYIRNHIMATDSNVTEHRITKYTHSHNIQNINNSHKT